MIKASLYLIIVLIIAAFSLAGCKEEAKTEELEAKIAKLEEEIEAAKEEITGEKEEEHSVAQISASQTTAKISESITFSAKYSTDMDGNINSYTYTWDFGDGYKGSGVSLTHTYAEAGEYTVSLTVKDESDALSTEVTTTVTIEEPTYEVKGSLIDTETDELLVGARIILGIQDGETSCYLDSTLSSLTDENGEFTIQVPGPGNYIVFYNISGEMRQSWDGLYLDYYKEVSLSSIGSIQDYFRPMWESMGNGRMLICLMLFCGEGWLTNVYSETQDLGFAWILNKPLTVNVTNCVSEINLAVWNWANGGCGDKFQPIRGGLDNTNLQEIQSIEGLQKIGIFEIFN